MKEHSKNKYLLSEVVLNGKLVGFELDLGEEQSSVLLLGREFVDEYTDQSDLPPDLRDPEPPRVIPLNNITTFEAAFSEFMELNRVSDPTINFIKPFRGEQNSD